MVSDTSRRRAEHEKTTAEICEVEASWDSVYHFDATNSNVRQLTVAHDRKHSTPNPFTNLP
jgi:hypothetical protein